MSSSTDDLRSFLNDGSTGGRRNGGGDRRSSRRPDRPVDRRSNRATPEGNSEELRPRRRASDREDAAALFSGRQDSTSEADQASEADQVSEAEQVSETIDHNDAIFAEAEPGVIADSAPSIGSHADVVDRPIAVGARPSSTLQRAWIDPEEMPFTPVPRPGNPLTARLIAWVGVLAFIAGLGWLIIPELDLRLTSLEIVELRDGVLTAQPVQLSPLTPSIVSELYVDASSLPDGVLPEGTAIALLEGTSQDGQRRVTNEITVPFDARFVSVDTLVGGVVMPGTPVATLYDPTQMYVIVTVRPELLDVMRRGMRARLVSEVAGVEIEGDVISAVPLLGTDHEPTTANLVNIRIKPDPEAVADLVPGIRFDAFIDLSSASPDAQRLVFTYAGHVDSDGAATEDEAVTDEGAPVSE